MYSRSTVFVAPLATVKDKSGERCLTAVGQDPVYDCVQPDVAYCSEVSLLWHVEEVSEVRAATCDVNSMVGPSDEVVDVLHRRKIDLCCAQETRWKGRSARMFGVIEVI